MPSIQDNTAEIHSHQVAQDDTSRQHSIDMTNYIAIGRSLLLALFLKKSYMCHGGTYCDVIGSAG